MTFIFWLLIFLILYCYFGYPAALMVLAKWRPWPVRKNALKAGVSVVMSVYNEEDVIGVKLANFLSLMYPSDQVEILIGSDGSTDKTDEIIKNFNDERIRFYPSSVRRGKMATINDLVAHARHDIVVFTDARQTFSPDAIIHLVNNFSDPNVGCVSGELIFSAKEGATAKGINLYWNYEKFIRRQEAMVHSMMGATGAIYAIRRELYTPLPEDIVLDDMYIPFKIIEKGYRAYFDDSAKAYDEVADNPGEEHRRKARTLAGNYQIFRLFPGLMNPLTSPIAIQLFSHKLLRLVVPFFMIVVFVVNMALASEPFYRGIFIAQILFYVMAMIGGLARHAKYGMLKLILKPCYVPYVFCLLNFSALAGFVRYIAGKQKVTWEKARES